MSAPLHFDRGFGQIRVRCGKPMHFVIRAAQISIADLGPVITLAFSKDAGDRLIDGLDGEGFGIEAPARSMEHGLVVLVVGITPGFEEPFISGRSVNILGRAAAGTFGADRIVGTGFGLHQRLEGDLVDP